MLNRRRGISEIIGSLIVLLIVSTLGTYLYNHTLSIISYEQNALELEMTTAGNRAQERLRVISIAWSPAYDRINITAFNYGEYETEVSDVYVNNVRVDNFFGGRYEEISVKGLKKISFEPPIAVQPDTLYEIVVVSQRGVSHVYKSES